MHSLLCAVVHVLNTIHMYIRHMGVCDGASPRVAFVEYIGYNRPTTAFWARRRLEIISLALKAGDNVHYVGNTKTFTALPPCPNRAFMVLL